VRDVAIRGNTFANCLYGNWGRAVIDINPEIAGERRVKNGYHSGITVEDNLFRGFDNRLLRAQCVDGLVVRRNRVESTNDYPAQPAQDSPYRIDHCSDCLIEEPATPCLA
jgi:hypothetical protein